jgi:hypothetical protein
VACHPSALTLTEDSARIQAVCGFGHGFRESSECVYALIIVAGGIVAAPHVGKISPALPAIRSDLGLSLVQGGFVVSMFYVLGMALALVVGVTADRLGRRLLIAAGFLFMGVGGVMGSMADGLLMLLASRFIEGIGFIGTVVAAPALMLAVASARDRMLALSLWSIFTPAGATHEMGRCYFAKYVQKKAALKGGLRLGRKRPKRRATISCCTAQNSFMSN